MSDMIQEDRYKCLIILNDLKNRYVQFGKYNNYIFTPS